MKSLITGFIFLSSLTVNAELLKPDLSFDGFALAIDEIEVPKDPKGTCETIVEDLQLYQHLELQNVDMNSAFTNLLAQVLESWYMELTPLSLHVVRFDDESLQPVDDLYSIVTKGRSQIEINGQIVGDLLYEIVGNASSCDLSVELKGKLVSYQERVEITNSKLVHYYRKFLARLEDVAVKLQDYGRQRKLFSEEIPSEIYRMRSGESMSGGLLDGLKWYKLKFNNIYAAEFKNILDSLRANNIDLH